MLMAKWISEYKTCEFHDYRNYPVECHTRKGLWICAKRHLQHQWGKMQSPVHTHSYKYISYMITFKLKSNSCRCLFPVLPVLSPVHRSVCWCWSHRDRSGKFPSSLSVLSLQSIFARFAPADHVSSAPLSFPYGLCNHTEEDYSEAFPQL